MTKAFGLGLLAVSLPLLCFREEVLAQDLEEIVVTAQKREQRLQDVPISISALSTETLEKRGMQGYRDWSDYVPGITMFQGQDTNRRTGPSATIRGVTHVSQGHLFEGSSTATTSYTLGQVPFFNGDPGLYDLARVEVLRGPQGTLYGIASMGGTVRFIPNQAKTDRFEAEVGLGGGMIEDGAGLWSVEGIVNLPLVEDVLAIRIAGRHSNNGGWIDQYFPSLASSAPLVIDRRGFDPRVADETNTLRNSNKSASTSTRLSFTYTPTDKLTVRGFGSWQKSDVDNFPSIDLNDARSEPVVSRYVLQPLRDEYFVGSLELSYDVGIGSLEYVGGYYWSANTETNDVTRAIPTIYLAGVVPALDFDGPGGLPPDPIPVAASFPFSTESNIRSHELRLQGVERPLFSSGITFDYVVGLFYQDEVRDGYFNIAAPGWNANRGPNTAPILTEGGVVLSSVGGSQYKNESAFIDVAFHLTDHFSIGGGVRYFDQYRDSIEYRFGDWYSGRATNGATVGDDLTLFDTPNNAGRVQESGITPRFTTSYRFNDDQMMYFTAAEGKRIPAAFPNPIALQGRPPECTTLAEELGILDDALSGTISDSVWSYELGLKSKLRDGRMTLNTAVYYLDWMDYQQTVQLGQFNPACNAQIAANVGEATSKGFEIELMYAMNENWRFDGSVAYTDAEFSSVPLGVVSSIPGVPLKKGDSLRGVAPWTVNFGIEYNFSMPDLWDNKYSGYIRADWRYVDERMNNYGDIDLLKADPVRSWYFADAYNLTDLRFGLESADLALSFYISNLFDETAVYESKQDFYQPNIRTASVSQPRTVGFHLKRSFR